MNIRKILRRFFYGIFVLGFVWVSAQLFFEKRTNQLFTSVANMFGDEELGLQLEDLTVIYPDQILSLEPTLNDPVTRQRINNIYEPLVKLDRDLKVQPGLAVSWGMLGNKVWQFRLRSDVVFHDGSTFDSKDVEASLRRALDYGDSEVAEVIDSIERIEVIDSETLQIETKDPDPLLLQRLSMVLMIPAEEEKAGQVRPIGTGSYKLKSWDFGKKLVVERFDDYWGKSAQFRTVELVERPGKNERVSMFLRGEADFLTFVPFDAVDEVRDRGFALKSIPSLEVQFLLFNFESEIFSSLENRKTFSMAINQKQLVEEVGGYARPVSQFVANGVLGYNPEVIGSEYDFDAAKAGDLAGKTIHLHIPVGLDVLGEHVRNNLAALDVSVIVSYMNWEDLWESIQNSSADLYFFGFKSEIGDAADFFDVVVHSDASYNVGSYSNSEVDALIETALTSLDPATRLSALQGAMKVIVERDILGVPLFEYETLYAMIPGIDFEPRIDGFLYFDDLILQ